MTKNIVVTEIKESPQTWTDPKTGVAKHFYKLIDEEGQVFDAAEWVFEVLPQVGDELKVIYATSTSEKNGRSYTNHRISKCSKVVSDTAQDIKTSPPADKPQQTASQQDFRVELMEKIDSLHWKVDQLIIKLIEKSIE